MGITLLEVIIHPLDSEEVLQFVSGLKRLAECANQVSKQLKEVIRSLEIEDKEILDEQRKCKSLLVSAETKARSFIDIVKRLFVLAEDREMSMKESFRNGDTSRIANFTVQIKRYLNRCEKAYSSFREKYDEAIELCKNVSEECRVKSHLAKFCKRATGVTGLVIASGTAITTLASGAYSVGITVAVTAGPVMLGTSYIAGGL